MKFKWTENDTSKVLTYSATLVIGILFFFFFRNFRGVLHACKTILTILTPFITGFAIAYILARPVNFFNRLFDKHLFKKLKNQHGINRGISIGVVLILAFSILSLIVYSIIPQLIESVSALIQNADRYFKSVNSFLTDIALALNIDTEIILDLIGSSNELFRKVTQYVSSLLPQIVNFSVSLGSGIYNLFIGLIISVYMLSSKEKFIAQTKKCLYAIFPKAFAKSTLNTFYYLHETFTNYFSGQILDSALLGLVCFTLMSILGMEYALLISMIILITNFIPFIGPFIGAVPSAFILLMAQPSKVLLFIIMILVLQLLDGYVFVPKIVGKTTGLSSFWVLFSIVVGGGLFGVPGIILAVPTFSVIFVFVKRFVDSHLKKKGLSRNSRDYM